MTMLRIVFLFGAVCLSSHLIEAIDDTHTDPIWSAFKDKYNKTYDNPEDEEKSRDHFEANMLHAVFHNMQDEHNYTKDVHEYSDMPVEDQIKALCNTVPPTNISNRNLQDFSTSERQLASQVDWVQKGKVTKVKNQGGCGSCWSFSTTGAIEGQASIKWDYGLWTLSEQQLVDCAGGDYHNNGCHGGWPDNGFRYVKEKGGLVEESCYPYTAKDGSCQIDQKSNCYHFGINGFVDVGPRGDENAVAKALADKGPMAIAIWVSGDFMRYSGGIFTDPNWNNQGVNHGVLLVGYGTDNGQDYWKIKNSWGESWGEKGYARVARNANNMIHIASYASYPTM